MSTFALVAASDFNQEHFMGMWQSNIFDSIIAVDGGYAHLKALGCVPTVAIGDFDSLGYVPSDVQCETHPSHKDASDLELALCRAQAEGAQIVYVYGALGGRIDHTIANIQLLAHFAEAGMVVSAVSPDAVLRYVVGPNVYELPPFDGGTVSVFSLTSESRGVTERGLEYPLDEATLTNRTTLGLSNEFTGQHASISVEEGTLLVIRPFIS